MSVPPRNTTTSSFVSFNEDSAANATAPVNHIEKMDSNLTLRNSVCAN